MLIVTEKNVYICKSSFLHSPLLSLSCSLSLSLTPPPLLCVWSSLVNRKQETMLSRGRDEGKHGDVALRVYVCAERDMESKSCYDYILPP